MLTMKRLTTAAMLDRMTLSARADSLDLFSSTSELQPLLHECYWASEAELPDELPVVVVPNDGDVEGFYADIATYFPGMSPISAHMYVLDSEFADRSQIEALWREPSRLSATFKLDRLRTCMFIAMALAEAAASSFEAGDRDGEVAYAVCRRTLSFTLARAAFVYQGYPLENVAGRWLHLRSIAKMETTPEIAASIVWIANLVVLPGVFNKKGHETEDFRVKLRSLLHRTISSTEFIEELSRLYPNLSKFTKSFSGDFDGRMEALENVVAVVRTNKRDIETDSLTIAFFCNLILPGSMTHMKFLTKLRHEYPSILIWYGLFAGLSENFDLRNVFFGVGQKLLRDVTSDFRLGVRPRADISLEEFAVLSRGRIKGSMIKPIQKRAVLVSIMPGIDVYARLPIENPEETRFDFESSHSEDGSRHNNTERDKKIQNLLFEAQSLLASSLAPAFNDGTSLGKRSRKTKTPSTRFS